MGRLRSGWNQRIRRRLLGFLVRCRCLRSLTILCYRFRSDAVIDIAEFEALRKVLSTPLAESVDINIVDDLHRPVLAPFLDQTLLVLNQSVIDLVAQFPNRIE